MIKKQIETKLLTLFGKGRTKKQLKILKKII